MNIEMTGTERVLYNVEYEFACNVLELAPAEAREMAMQKIIKTRTLSKQLKRTEYGQRHWKSIGSNSLVRINGLDGSSMYVTCMD